MHDTRIETRHAWRELEAGADEMVLAAAGEAAVLVPLSLWLSHGRYRAAPTGVWLAPEDDPAVLQPDLGRLAVIGVRFPVFTDGRGYSQAYLLRERYSFAGELRALGDVGVDQLEGLWRVGFDSYMTADGLQDMGCVPGKHTFSDNYQASFRPSQPRFRRKIQ